VSTDLALACVLLSLLPLSLACSDSRAAAPRLVVTASPVLRGDPVTLRAENLGPGRAVTLTATGKDQHGQVWSSRAAFDSDPAGTVDVARDAPTSGSYATPSREGPFWSMALDPAATIVDPMVSIDDVALSLLDSSGAVVAQAVLSFSDSRAITEAPVSTGIRGSFFAPSDAPGPLPALIVLGGSEGGCRRDLAAALASKLRVPVLALAYFGVPGSPLPVSLQNVPLEYFGEAMDWLDARPEVRPGSFFVLGISRGAELALLLASTYPGRIRGAVANVPSSLVWQGEGAEQGASAWTLGGRPVPFVATTMSREQYVRYQAAIRDGTPFAFREVYEYSIAQATPARLDEATILVERISGPVLLLSSARDGVWPSDSFAARIVSRLEASGARYPLTSLTYPSSGHLIQDGYQPTTLGKYWISYTRLMMDLGGTAEGSAAANADSWPKVVTFLGEHLHRSAVGR
jgi:pimeloyl-ACP methyl ester carboxylesterase